MILRKGQTKFILEKARDILTHDDEDGQRLRLQNCQIMIDSTSYNLRKTALGASSPAKPALHIPDLQRLSALIASHKGIGAWIVL